MHVKSICDPILRFLLSLCEISKCNISSLSISFWINSLMTNSIVPKASKQYWAPDIRIHIWFLITPIHLISGIVIGNYR